MTASRGSGNSATAEATFAAFTRYPGSSRTASTWAGLAHSIRPRAGGPANSDRGDVSGVDDLIVCEDRRHDLRQASSNRAHRGPESTVSEHQGGRGQHHGLRPPRFRPVRLSGIRPVRLSGKGARLSQIHPMADGHQHAQRQLCQTLQCLAETCQEEPSTRQVTATGTPSAASPRTAGVTPSIPPPCLVPPRQPRMGRCIRLPL